MVIETRSFFHLWKKVVVNSGFGRFLRGLQETCPRRTRKILSVYLKFEQQRVSDFTLHLFFVLVNFVTYFC